MAQATVMSAGKLFISLGNGASPEVFTAPCGLTTRGLALSKNVNETVIPDCADPDLPAWVGRDVVSLSGEVTGTGVLAVEAIPTWQNAFNTTASFNARIGLNVPLAQNGGYYQGKVHLTNFSIGGEQGNKVTVDVTLVSDGVLTWVPAVA